MFDDDSSNHNRNHHRLWPFWPRYKKYNEQTEVCQYNWSVSFGALIVYRMRAFVCDYVSKLVGLFIHNILIEGLYFNGDFFDS